MDMNQHADVSSIQSDEKGTNHQANMLFTIDGGNSFLASIISTNNSGKLVDTDFSETFKNIEDGLNAIISFLSNK